MHSIKPSYTAFGHGWRICYLLLIAALASGAVAAASLHTTVSPLVLMVILPFILAALLQRRILILLPASCILLFWYANHHVASLLTTPVDEMNICHHDGNKLVVQGVVDSRPERCDGGTRLIISVDSSGSGDQLLQTSGRVMLTCGEGVVSAQRGERIRFVGKVKIPRKLGLPGEFDYGRYLAFRGINATMFIPDAEQLTVVPSQPVSHSLRSIDSLALSGGRIIDETVPGQAGAVLKAILTGDRGDISDETEEVYARSGVSHLLSISGFHVGILAMVSAQLIFFAARWFETLLLRMNLRTLVPLLTFPVIVFYLALSGGAMATVRSVIMAAVCMCVLLLDRETDMLHSLFLAAFCILVISPQAVYDISFQLSFVALWGITLTAPLANKLGDRITNRFVRWPLLLLLASLSATLATLPVVAFHFGRASMTGILSNLAAVPLVGYGGVTIGFAGLLAATIIPQLGVLLLKLAGYMVAFSSVIIELFASVPQLNWSAAWTDLLFLILLLTSISLACSSRSLLILSSPLLVAWTVWAVMSLPRPDGRLTVHFLSVGQGDSAVVIAPGGETLLVDGGGYPGDRGTRFGSRTLVPALQRLGIRRIDRLVLTHAHPDHMGGLMAVVRRYAVGEFWSPYGCGDSSVMEPLRRLLEGQGTPMRALGSNSTPTQLGACNIEFLAPLFPLAGNENDDSLVFRLGWGKWHILFTGDTGQTTEEGLVSAGVPLSAQVLKVSHHGSRYSSAETFLDAVAPEHAVISAGRGNIYGLPSQETLGRLQNRSIHTCRTDTAGTITVTFGPEGMQVAEFCTTQDN